MISQYCFSVGQFLRGKKYNANTTKNFLLFDGAPDWLKPDYFHIKWKVILLSKTIINK